LKRSGFYVVPITGRPAGWCDHIARFWPVDAVVGENGGFTFYMKNGKRKRLDSPGADPDRVRKIKHLESKILARFPHAKWASDQAYREHDLAIDFCEDVPAWPKADIDALIDLCHKEGAHAKLSSIHVNAWFGDFDKKKGFQAWIDQGAPGLGRKFPEGFGVKDIPTPSIPKIDEWIYAGDSPNDEPMFGYFRFSVGVANIKNYLDRIKSKPTYITQLPSGRGFSELADALIGSRH
jgi:hydroxymethylpyrimidine pyrophosphatase-like HAD family hydrolase